MGTFFHSLFRSQEQKAKRENGICMRVLKLHPLINKSKIGTFCCTLLRIQRITKLHLPSWGMGFSWEAFSFLGLSFISSSLLFFVIGEIGEKTLKIVKSVGKATYIFCCQNQSFQLPPTPPLPSPSPSCLTQPHLWLLLRLRASPEARPPHTSNSLHFDQLQCLPVSKWRRQGGTLALAT